MTRRVAALVGAIVFALAGAAAGAGAQVAYAHADLVESNPLDGAMLTQLPAAIELTFSEAIAKPADLVVLGPDDQPLASGGIQMIDAVAWVELDPSVLAAPAAGWYTVSYQVTSADGHLVTGTTSFMLHTDGSTAMPPVAPSGGGASTSADPLVVGLLAAAAAVALVVALGATRRLLVTQDA